MRLLLDTHIWVWSLVAPERLNSSVNAELVNAANEIWLSPVSVWETMLLIERGRITVEEQPAVWLERMLRATPAREAPLMHEVAIKGRLVRLKHPDPADRFLAATAQVHDLMLVTADKRLLGIPGVKTVPNR